MIESNNRHEYKECLLYEYEKCLLKEPESKYISIPLSIIVDKEMDAKRVSVFSYIRVHCGLNNHIGFTVPDMIEWCGGKPDRVKGGSNDKFLNVIDEFNKKDYIDYLNDKSKSSYMKCRFNNELYYNECSNGYAIIYLDELEKIMKYKKKNKKDNSITNTNILLVFAYLRNKIIRRPNELKPEERTIERIKERRKRLPEAYYGNIADISNDINMSTKTIAKIIDILELELQLIVTDKAYRVKNENGKFRTLPTIFANTYKREDKYLLVTEENYSRTEIELKANNMNQNYKIDKRKRKEIN